MTSFLEVIAHNQDDEHRTARRAAVLSYTRIENSFGAFLATYGETGLDHLKDDIATVVATACEEVGHPDVAGTLEVVLADCGKKHKKDDKSTLEKFFDSDDDSDDDDSKDKKTSSVREARKPKMCPFHKEVVDISLAQGDPRAGFDSMSQHWGGPRHCDGEGYEGASCKFKPQMTTQSYWDEKAEKAQQKRQERAEQLEAQQPTEEITESPTEPVADTSPVEDITSEPQGAEVIDFPSEPSAVGTGYEHSEPLAVAAKVAADDGLGGKGTPSPKIDKRLWTPKNVKEIPLEGDESRHPTTRTEVKAQGYENTKELSGIGENKTERVDLPSSDNAGFSDGGEVGKGGTWSEKSPSAVTAAHDPDKNELVEIMRNNYDGFLPQAEVENAVVAHRQ